MKKISISDIIRSIRASVSNVVASKINDVTSEEIGTLSGVTENVAEQLQALEQKKKRFEISARYI